MLKTQIKFFIVLLWLIFITTQPAVSQTNNTPPYSSITITGLAKPPHSNVGLFKNGQSSEPIKTEKVDSNSHKYSIKIDILKDMAFDQGVYVVDMRFWEDANSNGLREKSEFRSACHFVVWDPSNNKVYMEVYNGSKYEINFEMLSYNL